MKGKNMVASTILNHWDIFKKEKFNIVRFPIYFKFLLVIILKPDINKIRECAFCPKNNNNKTYNYLEYGCLFQDHAIEFYFNVRKFFVYYYQCILIF
jgi:hypothetical protein